MTATINDLVFDVLMLELEDCSDAEGRRFYAKTTCEVLAELVADKLAEREGVRAMLRHSHTAIGDLLLSGQFSEDDITLDWLSRAQGYVSRSYNCLLESLDAVFQGDGQTTNMFGDGPTGTDATIR